MNTEPDWDLYRSFIAVLREGSLSGAARQLGLTQPTVARHVDALERAVGTSLFLRSQRGLIPTDLAQELRSYAEMMASTAAALVRTASSRAGAVSGSVRISASDMVGIELLPPIIAALRRRHPGLVIELALSNAVDDLSRREADIAVRMVQPVQEALVARRLPSITLGLHAHRAYLERRGTPVSIQELAGHDLIGFDHETPMIRNFVNRFPAFGRSVFALRTDSDVAQMAAIRAGFGIGFCQVAVACRDPDLVRLLADAVDAELGLWIVMHEELKTSARCRAVFDALVEGLTSPKEIAH